MKSHLTSRTPFANCFQGECGITQRVKLALNNSGNSLKDPSPASGNSAQNPALNLDVVNCMKRAMWQGMTGSLLELCDSWPRVSKETERDLKPANKEAC